MQEKVSIGRDENCNFKYLGLTKKSSKHQVTVDQSDYIEQLKKIQFASTSKLHKNKPLTTSEKNKLSAKNSQLLWIYNHTLPDINCENSL